MVSCSGQHHDLKQMPESPEALRGEDRGPRLPFHALVAPRPPGTPCWGSPEVSVVTRMERVPATDWRSPEVFRDSLGETESMRDTTDGDGDRISAT